MCFVGLATLPDSRSCEQITSAEEKHVLMIIINCVVSRNKRSSKITFAKVTKRGESHPVDHLYSVRSSPGCKIVGWKDTDVQIVPREQSLEMKPWSVIQAIHLSLACFTTIHAAENVSLLLLSVSILPGFQTDISDRRKTHKTLRAWTKQPLKQEVVPRPG